MFGSPGVRNPAPNFVDEVLGEIGGGYFLLLCRCRNTLRITSPWSSPARPVGNNLSMAAATRSAVTLRPSDLTASTISGGATGAGGAAAAFFLLAGFFGLRLKSTICPAKPIPVRRISTHLQASSCV